MIKIETLKNYCNTINVGDTIKICKTIVNKMNMCEQIITMSAKIISKYPHIVLTDKGCFQWFDLYIWNYANAQEG